MAIQTTTFKGARYLVKFHDPIEWSESESYEAIEAVLYGADTYISKQPVPAGVSIFNEDFWLHWADPNAQMEQLRQLVSQYVDNVEELSGVVGDLNTELANEIEARKNADTTINQSITELTKTPDKRLVIESEYDNSLFSLITIIKCIGIESIKCLNAYDYPNGIKEYIETDKPLLFMNGPMYGPTVLDGVSHEYPPTSVGYESWASVCIDENNNIVVLKDVNRALTSQDIINLGYKQSFRVWYPLCINGNNTNPLNEIPPTDSNYSYILQEKMPTRLMCWNDFNDMAFISFAGRVQYNEGVFFSDARNYAKALGYANIVLMDGGGSIQAWTSKPAINHEIHNENKTYYDFDSYRHLRLMLAIN